MLHTDNGTWIILMWVIVLFFLSFLWASLLSGLLIYTRSCVDCLVGNRFNHSHIALNFIQWAVFEAELKWRQTEGTEGQFTWEKSETALLVLEANGWVYIYILLLYQLITCLMIHLYSWSCLSYKPPKLERDRTSLNRWEVQNLYCQRFRGIYDCYRKHF